MPDVPNMITSQDEALNYITESYWDNFFSDKREYPAKDTALFKGVSKTDFEEAFANYLTFLSAAPLSNAINAQKNLMEQIRNDEKNHPESNIPEHIRILSEKYLYDPNSPYRNEEYFIPVLQEYMTLPSTDTATKARYGQILPLCCLNRLGTKANDFSFMLRNGRRMNLYDINADKTLLFFSNPGCENCKEILGYLKDNEDINNMIASGQLAVVTVYPDSDLSEWFGHSALYPKEWINGYDPDGILDAKTIYDIRAIPSLYLLDNDKKVILKDATVDNIISQLLTGGR